MTLGLSIIPGQVFEATYPFVRDTFSTFDEEGSGVALSWKPGTRAETRAVYTSQGLEPDTDFVADAMGAVIYTVVDTFKPGRFPTRVFYTRKWRDPEGREFGKAQLRIATQAAFHRRAKGFWYEFRTATPEETSDAIRQLKAAGQS